ncbi:MAG: DUF4845 domain-containing protein [Gammaproteobacteria bacterium]|nr:DUF4845 domain-containing protein [Gammaproteobacteria bacterium]
MGNESQRGAGLWSTLFVLLVVGFIALVTVKVLPLYLNQMKITAAIKDIAQNGGLHGADDPDSIHEGLQRHWDIDDIEGLDPRDVKVVREQDSLHMAYDYEARARLFYNVYVVIHFQDDRPIVGGRQGF